MTPEERAMIEKFLDSLGTLTLATQGQRGPWAAALFFARDERLNLYFISNRESQHVRDLLATPEVAVTVNRDHDGWHDIRGLQISGTAEPVPSDEKERVTELYLEKFPKVARLASSPENASEKAIGEALAAGEFFRIRPKWLRMIDNTRGFGHRTEITVGSE